MAPPPPTTPPTTLPTSHVTNPLLHHHQLLHFHQQQQEQQQNLHLHQPPNPPQQQQPPLSPLPPQQQQHGVPRSSKSSTSSSSKSAQSRLHPSLRPPKRRCVSNACIACRRRKSKCDGNMPSCAACASVYHTECVYDPNSDLRRKGATVQKQEPSPARKETLQVLMESVLTSTEDRVLDLVHRIRSATNLEELAAELKREHRNPTPMTDSTLEGSSPESNGSPESLEAELSGKMATLRVDEGQVRFLGATSNLVFIPASRDDEAAELENISESDQLQHDATMAILSWTNATENAQMIAHFIQLYFTYHYTFFTTLSKELFFPQFYQGWEKTRRKKPHEIYCTPFLVNVMLALGCHFSSLPEARAIASEPDTVGDQFFEEAKYHMMTEDAYARPTLTNIQALALMSVREAGCGRESAGWAYSGMSFRMATEMGLHLDPAAVDKLKDHEVDVRRVTFWGLFLFDKCWSNYMGRIPQIPTNIITTPKPDVFPAEDSALWFHYTDNGVVPSSSSPPSRTRAIARQISALCEISHDILRLFYNPTSPPHPSSLPRFDSRLTTWASTLPVELSATDTALPSTLLMHMFHRCLFIHLYRPFLSRPEYRHCCITAAHQVADITRRYTRLYGLKEICNVAAYFIHTAVSILLLTPQCPELRECVVALREMGKQWLVAKRAVCIVDGMVERWGIVVDDAVKEILVASRGNGQRWGIGVAGGIERESPRDYEDLQGAELIESGWWQGQSGEAWRGGWDGLEQVLTEGAVGGVGDMVMDDVVAWNMPMR
ncbi:hypothetical protein EX30DRAFT_394788 [Ascodesmis nigricans]|uniref:Zn(2)-C6 fungal-type domain-containing protein n=1 Tax=Ascodesmis nigricans TaxID=341454 RepID=A0A4S2N0L4_9PEZI|nr:hypothetical protein EX30DRAFT_394788 [Ascodesmis nigricans]